MSLSKGLGVGWRPQLASFIERRKNLSFIEILADNHMMDKTQNSAIAYLLENGVQVVCHSIGLSLGGSSLPDDRYIDELNRLAALYDAVVFSEHIAFVRSGGIEAGHLLPIKRDENTLSCLVENINYASSKLNRPLVLENIASFVEWPENSMEEPEFLNRVLKETDSKLLLDISNLYANSVNNNFDPKEYVDSLPLDKVCYMHMAGGIEKKGIYHDTHSHALNGKTIDLLKYVCSKVKNPSVLLERDDLFPYQNEFDNELDIISDSLNPILDKEALSCAK